jgi:hypothetical protein
MTNEQLNMLERTIRSVFGECKTTTIPDDLCVVVEAKQASVIVYMTGVEVESISGPQMVAGWSIGLLDGDGEFVEEEETILFWHVISTVAELIAEQAVYAAHMNLEAERVMEEQQYE